MSLKFTVRLDDGTIVLESNEYHDDAYKISWLGSHRTNVEEEIKTLPKYTRGKLIMPALLKDTKSNIVIKAVILDISAIGLRMITNDKLMRLTPENVLMEKIFDIEFDFFDIDTGHIQGRIANIVPGMRHNFERQLGIEFTQIDKIVARDINRIVLSELS